MTIDFKALAAKAAATGTDMTKATTGGGDYTPAAEGPGLCRFIGYVELGKQKGKMKGKEEIKEKVMMIFELVGKRHAVEEGQQPHRVTITENFSLNEKANFYKLFNRMNYKQDATHIAALLGEGFKCEVVHDKWTGADGKERVDVTLRNDSGYTLAPPRKEDEDSESGWVDVTVPPTRSDIRCFLWNHADLDQWAGLYIEGEYPERRDATGKVTAKAKSKNVLQNKIMGATNFIGSPIHTLLTANGAKLDLPAPGEDPDERAEGNEGGAAANTQAQPVAAGASSSTTSPSNDALSGIV